MASELLSRFEEPSYPNLAPRYSPVKIVATLFGVMLLGTSFALWAYKAGSSSDLSRLKIRDLSAATISAGSPHQTLVDAKAAASKATSVPGKLSNSTPASVDAVDPSALKAKAGAR